MKRLRLTRLLPAGGLLLLFLLAGAPPAAAQQTGPQVQIGRPAEGETLYAGPSSLQYNIPINGWAYSDAYDSPQLEVLLEVFSGERLLNSQRLHPNPDGSFLFNGLINPHNSEEVFPAEHAGCADYCHFSVDLVLPPGALRLRVTATDPAGNQAVDERSITVDLSEIVEIPVRLVLADGSEHSLQGVQVTASTRLYLWRTRHNLAAAGPDGRLDMPVEALSAAPTHYLLQVEPQLVDGVFYSGTEPVEITLAPGVRVETEVVLPVRTQTGRISGQLTFATEDPAAAVPVLAFHLPEGTCQQALAGESGGFIFESLPIGPYLITAGEEELARLNYTPQEILLDLSEDLEATVNLQVSASTDRQVLGRVLEAGGQPLPFAWVAAAEQARDAAALPEDGMFRLAGLEPQPRSLTASAPGYYSQAQALPGEPGEAIEFQLVRRPETQTLAWGSGEVVIPPETNVAQDGMALALAHGWLWGAGGGAEPLEIRYQGHNLRIQEGRFALEAVPGRAAWLYLFDGRAELQPAGGGAPVAVTAGQMVALDAPRGPQPVDYRPELVAGLQAQEAAPALNHVWQPGLRAVIRDRLARFGIGIAQVLTFITYMLVTLAVVSGPLLIVFALLKRRRTRQV